MLDSLKQATARTAKRSDTSPLPLRAEQAERSVRTLSRLTACLAAIAVGAVVFGLVSSASAQSRLSAFEKEAVLVCVAKSTIPAGTTIESGMVTTVEMPSGYAAANALETADDVVGKTTVKSLSANEQITVFDLATVDNTSTLSSVIEPETCAISIAVDAETGLAGLVRQEDRVDVLAEGVVLVENAKVVAVDASLDEALETYATVTLQMAEEDALVVQAAQDATGVRLVMRPASEHAAQDIPTTSDALEG